MIAIVLILCSYVLCESGNMESACLRNGFVICGALLGFIALALPLFQQPHFQNHYINYVIGLPLTALGIIGRIYPMFYLHRLGTTTAMDQVEKLVDRGPYRWVRHPQYAFGLLLLTGWYLVWGAVLSLCMMPLIGGLIYVQAMIEERYILEKRFGGEYKDYKKRVGMFFPRLDI